MIEKSYHNNLLVRESDYDYDNWKVRVVIDQNETIIRDFMTLEANEKRSEQVVSTSNDGFIWVTPAIWCKQMDINIWDGVCGLRSPDPYKS